MDKPASTGGRLLFPALTGIRAVAAFMVFFHHLPFHLKPGFFTGIQLSFHTGVTLFFVLSGFLITYSYYETASIQPHWLKGYFIRRFARIYPVYFLLLTLVVIKEHYSDIIFLIQNYTLTHNLIPFIHSRGMAIIPSWSLTVEECFYVLAPVVILLLRRQGLALVFIFLAALSIPVIIFSGYSLHIATLYPLLMTTLWGRFFEFFCGIVLAKIIYTRQTNNKLYHQKDFRYTLAGAKGIIICQVIIAWATNKAPDTRMLFTLVVNNILLPVAVAIFYRGIITEQNFVSKILSGKVFSLSGKSSYAFYLLHYPVILYFSHPIISGTADSYYNIWVLCTLLVIYLASVLLYMYYEKPANQYIRRKLL